MTPIRGIYRIRCLESGKCYVGSSNNILKRWKEHRRDLNKNTHVNGHLQSSWNLYKKDCFIFEIIEQFIYYDKEYRKNRETEIIEQYKTTGFCYNICSGMNPPDNANKKGKKLTELHKKRISMGCRGENSSKSSLTNKEVEEIRKEYKIFTKSKSYFTRNKHSISEIAKKYEVSKQIIYNIITNRTWRKENK